MRNTVRQLANDPTLRYSQHLNMEDTIHGHLMKFAHLYGDKEALITIGKGESRKAHGFNHIYERSMKLAKGLIHLGVRKGDIIGVGIDTKYNWLVVTYSIIMSGAIPLYLEFYLKDGTDIIQALNTTKKCRMILIETGPDDFRSKICKSLVRNNDSTWEVSSETLPSLEYIFRVDAVKVISEFPSLDVILERSVDHIDLPTITSNDVAILLMTSGSTGPSKIVMHSHSSLLTIGDQFCEALHLSPEYKYLNVMSFNWMGGFPVMLMSQGVTHVTFDDVDLTLDDKINIILRCNQMEGCKISFFFPRLIDTLMQKDIDPPLKMKVLATGGCPVSRKYADVCGILSEEFVSLYGSTEGGIMCATKNVYDSDQFEKHCVGKPQSGVKLKIVDGAGDVVKSEMLGDIYVRHKGVFVGYLNAPEQTEAAFTADRWFKTGDFGFIDKAGNVVVKGRKGDMHTCGVDEFNIEMLTPSDLEDILKTHKDVVDVYVLPMSDEVTSTSFFAFIETQAVDDMSDELHNHIQTCFTNAGDTECILKFHFMSNLPRLRNGKINKKGLKEKIVALCEK